MHLDPGSPGSVRRLAPSVADAAGTSYAFLATLVDPLIVELCRLRIAQIVGNAEQLRDAQTAMRAALPEVDAALLEDLTEWRDSTRFDAAQKACLEFAEYFCYSPESVTDEHVVNLRPYLSDEQILSLASALWVSDAFYRLSNFLKFIPDADPGPPEAPSPPA